MRNSKIYNILTLLDKKQKSKFREFVDSPYFNKNQNIRQLLQYLLQTKNPSFHKAGLAITKQNNPTHEYVLNQMSKLVKLFDLFIGTQKKLNQPFEMRLSITEAYDELALTESFEKNWKKLLQENESEQIQDANQHYNRFVLHRLMGHSFTKSDVRQNDENLQVLADSLDIFYLAEKLRITCEMLNRINIVRTPYQIKMAASLIKEIEDDQNNYFQHAVVQIYYLIYQSFVHEENEDHYQVLKDILRQNHHQFTKEEAREMYVFAQNYCIKKINQGDKKYYKEIFQLYRQLLDNEILLIENEISEWDYKNIVTTGTRLGHHQWVLDFMNNYRPKLNKSVRRNAYHYNLANFYYSTKDYDQAITLLRDIEFTDLYYALGSRSILLKSYYEQNELEALQSLVQAFKIYLKRNKTISTYQHQTHLNLVKLVDKLFRLKFRSPTMRKITKQKELEKVKNTITEYDIISNKTWLIDQVDIFEKTI